MLWVLFHQAVKIEIYSVPIWNLSDFGLRGDLRMLECQGPEVVYGFTLVKMRQTGQKIKD